MEPLVWGAALAMLGLGLVDVAWAARPGVRREERDAGEDGPGEGPSSGE